MKIIIDNMTKYRYITFILSLVGVIFIISSSTSGIVHAAPVTGFNAGNIIDDPTFTNSSAMNTNQIQAFLNSKVPSCDTQGTQTSEFGGGTRAQWATSRGYPPPYTCLRDYIENGFSAAQIIYNTAQTYQINPQVLIVLLQKEQGLVTDTWPTSNQYKSATGYGCPDSTPGVCSSEYYGFTNQVQWAARMFHAIITASPNWYTPYVLGNNYIKWSPNSSCGGSNVNIQNRATQSLYNYTPYQPNQSALNAGYGMGDSCGAYGNRNFYLYFTEWFGSTTINGTFLRTTDDATLYLVEAGIKYPIVDINNFNALYPLGGVGFVAQSYLDSLATGSVLGRVIRSGDGTVYFYDAGIKLSFGSCALVEAYGSSCGQSIPLSDSQINALSTGPSMTSVLKTTSGKTFYMDGKKREAYEQAVLNQYGASISSANMLNETALNSLAVGIPILADGTFLKSRTTGELYGYASGVLNKINSTIQNTTYLNTLNPSAFDAESIAKLTPGAEMLGYIKSQSGLSYILTDAGKMRLTSTTDWQKTFTVMPDTLLNKIPDAGTLNPMYFLKSKNSGTVYLLSAGEKRPIQGWGDLLTLNSSPTILNLSDYYVDSFKTGATVLSPGGLVKSPDDGTVYLIDGLNKKIPLTSFNPSIELGFKNLKIASSDAISKYPISPSALTSSISCGSSQGVAIGGNMYVINIPNITYTAMSDINCSLLSWKDTPGFFLAPDGTIYQLKNAQKHPIGGYQTYLNLGGNSGNTIRASGYVLGMFPTGLPL